MDFRSDEEKYFYYWLLEAASNGLLVGIEYEPETFELSPRAFVPVVKQLKTKTKVVDKFLFHPHSYTPDFTFYLVTPLLAPFFIVPNCGLPRPVYVDVKGTFNKFGDPKQFSINQKWMWDKYRIYVHKIVPEKFFKKTWCPEAARYSPVKKQPVKKYIGVPNVDEFLHNKKKE